MLDLDSLEPPWIADDGTCLLFAGPGHYVVWKFGTPPVSLVNSNFIAHRLTRHGVVVGRLQLPDGTDSFGHQLPRSRGVLWIPGQPAPVEITPDDYAYRFPKDAAIAPDVGLTYQLTGTPSGLPELIGLVQDFPTLHDVWDLNAAGQAVGNATVYLRPLDLNNDGVIDANEINFSPSERHQYTTNGDLNWLIITERGVTAGYSGDAFHEVHYNALLASAARFDTNGWRWLGPLATNDANGSASALSIALLANDAGMIAGYAAARTGNPQVDALFPSHAFRYTPASPEFALGVSVLTDLGVLSGGLDSFPRAMNQYGEVVGHADFDTLQLGGGLRDPRMLHAVYWSASAIAPNDLGTLGPVPGLGFPQGHSDAYAINDLTQIVGTSFRPSDGASTAVFWQLNRNRGPGASSAPFWEINDFNNSIIQSGWYLSKAVGVNNDRFVLAKGQRPFFAPDGTFIGWSPRAVLLPPVSIQSRDRFFTGSIEMPDGTEPGDFVVTFSLRSEGDTLSVIEGPIRAQERIYESRAVAAKAIADKIATSFGGAPRFQDKVVLYRDPSRPRQLLFAGYSPKFGTLEIDVRVQGRIWPTIPHVLDEDAEFAEFAVHFDQLCRGQQSFGSPEFPTVFPGPQEPIFPGIGEFTDYQRGEPYPTQDLSEQLYTHALNALLLESFIKDEIKLPLVYVRGVVSGLTDGIIFDATAIRDVAVVGSAVVIAAQFGPAYLAYLAAFHPEAITARVEALETVIEGLKKIKLADVPVIARNVGRGIYRQWTTKVQSDTGWFYDGQPVGSNPEIMRKYTEGYVTGFVLEQAGVTLATAGISKYAALPKLAREFVRLLEIARAGVEGIALQGANQVRKAVVATYLVHAASAPTEGWLRNMSRAAFRVERHIPGGRFSAEEMNRIFNSLREKGVYEADRVVLEMTRTRWFKPQTSTPAAIEQFQTRYLQVMTLLEKELPVGSWGGTEGLVRTLDRLFPEGASDRVGDLMTLFKADTAEGQRALIESLAAFRIASEGFPAGQQVKFFAKNLHSLYPDMYHYAPELKRLAVVNGEIRLTARTERGWYVTPEQFSNAENAYRALELPELANARYRIKTKTIEINEALKMPYGNVNRAQYFEPVTKDFPIAGGSGGARQLLLENQEARVFEVFDTVEQRVLSQQEIIQLITQ